MEDYQDRLRIATPEGVAVEVVLAGLGSRFVATLVDLTLKLLLIVGSWLLGARIHGGLGLAVASVLSFLAYFGYDVAFEVLSGGRTPGKRWNGLRVLRDDGRPVDLLSSAVRNVLRLVDGLALAYLPAMVSILVTRRNQRIGDLAASTIVVRDPRPPKPARRRRRRGLRRRRAREAAGAVGGLPGPEAPGTTPAAGAGALDMTAVTADDLAVVRSFLARRHQLDEAVRADLARRIAGALAPRVGGGTEHLGDEQLLEHVATKGRGAGVS